MIVPVINLGGGDNSGDNSSDNPKALRYKGLLEGILSRLTGQPERVLKADKKKLIAQRKREELWGRASRAKTSIPSGGGT